VWQDLLEPEEAFCDRYRSTGVPDHLLCTVWQALRPKVSQEEREANNNIMDAPSFDDFKAALQAGAPDSAPGPSGLSYNMMKLWSDDIKRKVYGHLIEMWKSHTVPDYWKWRWLAPIPKTEDPSLTDLRPIVLIESLRKVWASIFVRRIRTYWDDTGILHPGQHGYLRGKGTDTAVVEVLNALETAKEYKSPIFMSSWDIRLRS
jgi:hypothetical protein